MPQNLLQRVLAAATFASIVTGITALSAQAAIGPSLGYTSRAASLGGAMAGASGDSASAYQNPAGLSSTADHSIAHGQTPKLQAHWGILFLAPEFKSISNVVVENDYTSDRIRSADVDTDYPSTFGQSLGLAYQFQKTDWHWSFGFVSFLPLENLALVDSGESFVPEYVLHRSRNQKPEFDFGFGARPTSRWSIGIGLHLGTALNSNTTVFLQTGASKTSSMRVSAGLKTKASPYLGTQIEFSDAFRGGLVVRLPLEQKQKLKVLASGRALDTIAALDFNYQALGAMYYDPFTIELGTEWKWTARQTLFAQLDYQAWSDFRSPSLEIHDPSTTTCSGCGGGIQFVGTRTPVFPLRDIVIPHLGYELFLSDAWAFRAGYSYRPSIYKDTPSGAGNFLDPGEHRIALGMGKTFTRFLEFDTPCRIDFHVSLHPLESQHVEKTPGDEQGGGTGRKIGDPGYDVGGFLWGAGASLALAL